MKNLILFLIIIVSFIFSCKNNEPQEASAVEKQPFINPIIAD